VSHFSSFPRAEAALDGKVDNSNTVSSSYMRFAIKDWSRAREESYTGEYAVWADGYAQSEL
jgi:hypothetical protein